MDSGKDAAAIQKRRQQVGFADVFRMGMRSGREERRRG
jgi:hypothetical protein